MLKECLFAINLSAFGMLIFINNQMRVFAGWLFTYLLVMLSELQNFFIMLIILIVSMRLFSCAIHLFRKL